MNVDFSLPEHHLAMQTLGSPGEALPSGHGMGLTPGTGARAVPGRPQQGRVDGCQLPGGRSPHQGP